MNIVHLVGSGNLPKDPDRSPVSGIVRVPLEIARRQAILGHQVTVLTVGNEYWTEIWGGVRLQNIRGRDWAKLNVGKISLDFRQHFPIWLYLRSRSIDILHSHSYTYLRGIHARGKIIHFHSDPLYSFRGATMSVEGFERILRSFDIQIAVSAFIEQQLKIAFKGRARTTLVRNGVNLRTTEEAETSQMRASFRKELGIPLGAFVVGFSGAVIPEKGVMELAKAFRDAAARDENIHLLIAGDFNLWGGRYNATANDGEAYVHSIRDVLKPCVNRAHFAGKLPGAQMPIFYAASDVLAAPSIWPEPYPLSVLEAMVSGLPVIASNIGGLPELVEETRGRLVQPGDIDGLRDAVLELANDPGEMVRLGGQAKAFATKVTWDDAVKAIMDIYQEILESD